MPSTGSSEDVVGILRQMKSDLETELARVCRMLNAADGIETRTNTTEILSEMFQDNPDEEFTAAEAEAEIRKRGWVTESGDPVNAVRAALARLKNNGEIQAATRGRFSLVHEIAHEEPRTIATNSGGYDDPWASPPPAGRGSASDDEPPF